MTSYRIVRSNGRTFLFANDCDFSSHILLDTTIVTAQEVLETMQTNRVAPEHISSVYEDLIFLKNMV